MLPNDNNNQNKIVFEIGKGLRIFMLVVSIIFFIPAIVFLIQAIKNANMGELIGVLIFVILALISLYLYLLFNKKVVYENNTLTIYNIFGKHTSINVKDIKQAIEMPLDGMKLIYDDNKYIKIDVQMNNYAKIKDILEKNNISYEDKNGNNAPKGW